MLAENSDSPDARLEAQVTFHWLHSSGFGVTGQVGEYASCDC